MSNFNSADIAAFKDVWVFCEQREGKLMPTDFELISEGRKLADELGVEAVRPAAGRRRGIESAPRSWAATAPTRCIVCDEPPAGGLHHRRLCQGHLRRDRGVLKPEAFLIGATNIGRDLGPRCAARLHTGLCADCTHLDVDVANYIQFLRESSTLDVDSHEVGSWRTPEPEDDPSRLRRPPDGHHHLPPVPSLHGDGASRRDEEERLRPGQGRCLRDREAQLSADREPT